MSAEARQTPSKDDALTAERLAAALGGARGLPADPLVTAAVVELLDAPAAADTETRLERLIAADATIAASLVSLARRRDSAVGDLASALGVLSAEDVKAAVLSAPTWHSADATEGALDRRELAVHSFATATAAGMLCERSGVLAEPAKARLWGLLHDIGKLALSAAAPKSHARACDEARLHADELSERELQVIGLDHTEAGRKLAELLRLDDDTTRAIWLHHQPFETLPAASGAAEPVLVSMLADAVAREAHAGESGSYSPVRIPAELPRRLGITKAELDDIRDKLTADVAEIHALLRGDERSAERLINNARLELLGRRVDAPRSETTAGRLTDFSSRLDAGSQVAEVLAALLEVWTCPSNTDGDKLAYYIDATGRSVSFVRMGKNGRTETRILRTAQDLPSNAPPAGFGCADDVAAILLDEPDDLTDFAPIAGLAHRTLSCGRTWLGGVFAPAEALRSDFDSVEPVLGLILALAGGKSLAQRTGKELAAAGRAMERTRRVLDENRTLAAIAEMAAGAAHEINTPLAVISGRSQWMLSRCENDDQHRTWQTVSDKAQQVSDVITALMEYAQPGLPQPERIHPRELLESAAQRFCASEHPQARSIRVDIEVGEHVPAVWADRAQVSSALSELLNNAATAAEQTGRALVRLWAQGDSTGERVVLAVSDAGGGMDPDLADAATTPFYCSQQSGRRRGLGLSMAKRYAEINAGSLRIATAAGAGTTVRIELPSAGSSDENRQRTDDGT